MLGQLDQTSRPFGTRSFHPGRSGAALRRLTFQSEPALVARLLHLGNGFLSVALGAVVFLGEEAGLAVVAALHDVQRHSSTWQRGRRGVAPL
jgi:hypothetical protein